MNFHPFLKGWSFGSVNLRAAVKLSIRTGQDERFGGKMLHNLKPFFFFFICLFLSFLRGLAACTGSTQSVSPFHHIRAYLTVKMCVIQKMVYNWPQQTLCPPPSDSIIVLGVFSMSISSTNLWRFAAFLCFTGFTDRIAFLLRVFSDCF